MGMKEYIPAPSRPKRKSTGKTKGGGKSKRQKTGEEDEEEDGEDEEEADDGGDTAEGEGTDEQSHAAVPPSPNSKAARSLHGLASMVKKEGEEGGSARKKSNARGGGGSARKAAPAVRRTQSMDSSGGAGGDDGGDDGAGGASGATRRSGRQRKQKRKFEDEEYDDGDDIGEEEEEEEAPSTARRKATGKGAAKQPPTIDYDDEQALEYDDGQPHAVDEHDTGSNRQSPYTSQPPSNTNSAPTTPLRTGKVALSGHTPGGGGINQLSQLSPLSQLSQATEIDLSAHMLPASSYNPKLKPYPGLHMRSSVMGRMPMPASTISRAHHQLPSQLAVGDTATGEEGADAAEDAGAAQPVQPEFAKVYSFLGSLFDPSTSGHIEELDKMTPVNKDIVQKLMQNLASWWTTQACVRVLVSTPGRVVLFAVLNVATHFSVVRLFVWCFTCSESIWQSLAGWCGQRLSFIRFIHAHGSVIRRASALVAGQRRQRLSTAGRPQTHAHEQFGQHRQSGCTQSRPRPSVDRHGSTAVRVANATATRTHVRLVARWTVAHLCRCSCRIRQPHGPQCVAHLSTTLLQLRGINRERDPSRLIHDCLTRPERCRPSAVLQQHLDD